MRKLNERLILTPEDQEPLTATLARMSREAGFPITLNELRHKWLRLVRAIERGYDDSIYEYENDLNARELLYRVQTALSPEGGVTLLRLLGPWDDRFRSATRKVGRPVIATEQDDPDAFWRERVPIRPGRELEADLRSEGLL